MHKGPRSLTELYSLFPVPCSLFPVPCSLFPVPCLKASTTPAEKSTSDWYEKATTSKSPQQRSQAQSFDSAHTHAAAPRAVPARPPVRDTA
jgi:hypothetical protein